MAGCSLHSNFSTAEQTLYPNIMLNSYTASVPKVFTIEYLIPAILTLPSILISVLDPNNPPEDAFVTSCTSILNWMIQTSTLIVVDRYMILELGPYQMVPVDGLIG
jgi:hypothetical protein